MKGTSTVLILGAGASVDCYFPTGRQLLMEICSLSNKNNELFVFLTREMTFKAKETLEFRQALLRSQAPSVDLFLENRREFEDIGKAAIAARLIRREDFNSFDRLERKQLWQKEPQKADLWYELLFSRMIEGGRFEENKLSVITFNYDRSLEAFFFSALCNLEGLAPDEAQEKVDKIPVIHMYGSLGSRLWKEPGERGRDYSPTLTPDAVAEAASLIRIMGEPEVEKKTKVAREQLSQANEIIFLGFGFHPANITRLCLPDVENQRNGMERKGPQVFASRIGMGKGDIQRASIGFSQTFIPTFGDDNAATITEFLKGTRCLIL